MSHHFERWNRRALKWMLPLVVSGLMLPGLMLSGMIMLTAGTMPADARVPDHLPGSFYPGLIADVAEEVAPSVVNIDVQRKQAVALPEFGGLPFGDEVFRRFFGFGAPGAGGEDGQSPFFQFKTFPSNPSNGGAPETQERVLNGNGSGIILDKAGHVLTNNHVVAGADQIIVTIQDGKQNPRKIPATVIGRDSYTDLAVLQLQPSVGGVPLPNLTPIHLANDVSHLRPGEWVLAIGSPLGFDHTVTMGIVSAISRRIPDLNANVEFIQTDAAINPGNSGGPLVNLAGEAVGINTAISGRGQNIGFAIPVDIARQVANALITEGHIARPWIGVSLTELNPTLAKSLGLDASQRGVVVAQVMQDSPAAKAGFRQGDVIQRIDGKPVEQARSVQALVKDKPLHSTVNFQVLRSGQMLGLSVITDQLPDDASDAPSHLPRR